MKLPIILFENNSPDINYYMSEEALKNEIEAVDIYNNEYVLYDASGYHIKINVNANRKRILGLIPAEDITYDLILGKESDQDTLIARLIENATMNKSINIGSYQETTLSELIELLEPYAILHK